MFVLLPMLRLSVTKMREKGLNYLLPLDKHVSFHALTGKLIAAYSLVHTVCHLVNLGEEVNFRIVLHPKGKYFHNLFRGGGRGGIILFLGVSFGILWDRIFLHGPNISAKTGSLVSSRVKN